MANRRPPNAGKGRPKGSKNRVNVAFREAVILAFGDMGGVPALVAWGREHQTEFYKIAARLIPTELAPPAAVDGSRVTKVIFEYVTTPAEHA